jgi:hypothetical protein
VSQRAARLLAIAAVMLCGIAIGGCTSKGATVEDATDRAAVMQQVPGTELHRITLSAAAARQLSAKTVFVADPPVASVGPSSLVIPTSAVVYDPEGKAWTFVKDAAGGYTRVAIVIDHFSGSDCFLTSGPPVGAAVVTAGSPELLGIEYGVGEE